jgi:hypothetical protein
LTAPGIVVSIVASVKKTNSLYLRLITSLRKNMAVSRLATTCAYLALTVMLSKVVILPLLIGKMMDNSPHCSIRARKSGMSISELNATTGRIEPITPEGRVTVFLLRLNDPERIIDRVLLMAINRYPYRKDNEW